MNPSEASNAIRRFWSFVNTDGPTPSNLSLGECWIWTGSKDGQGYGKLSCDGKPIRATHLMWFIQTGAFPKKGFFVCHHCDNPSCVRASHLFLGTPRDNIMDARSKGRMVTPWELGCIPHNTFKTHCPLGHPYDAENTIWNKGHTIRKCRTCQRNHNRIYMQRIREALQPAKEQK